MSAAPRRPAASLRILVAALGGEGGGVFTDWIAEAARLAGLRVQCTSIPGVAQRTGATTYYIEIVAADCDTPLALTPMPGAVDLVVASELVEAARAVQNGYVTSDRTCLVASTHRVYATSEKSAMGDERYDAARARRAATDFAQRAILFDMSETVRESRSAISAVLLGAVAASRVLPIARETFERVIAASGIAVKGNLAGFALAWGRANRDERAPATVAGRPTVTNPDASGDAEGLIGAMRASYPVECHDFVERGIRRLVDYQDLAYARLYVERLGPIARLDGDAASGDGHALLRETARHLALRMSFEDLIRVADLKTRRTRFERVRAETGAKPGQPVIVTEYFKPGVEELSGFLPPRLALALLAWAERRGGLQGMNVGVHLETSSVGGFTLLWLVSRLRRWRRVGHRYQQEQRQIEGWLRAVADCANISRSFGLEMVATARLIKGYSGTYRRGVASFERIMATVVGPAIAARRDATDELRTSIGAALRHGGPEIATPAGGFKPIAITRNAARS